MRAGIMIDLCKSLARIRAVLAFALVASFVAVAVPTPAAAVSSEEAARKIAEEYAVTVLRVRAGVVGNTPVWLVTVMRAGGNFNGAFQVTTLAVDQESGKLVPEFQHSANGYRFPEGQVRGTRLEQRPEAMRSGVWR
jgi:hypothetical protein